MKFSSYKGTAKKVAFVKFLTISATVQVLENKFAESHAIPTFSDLADRILCCLQGRSIFPNQTVTLPLLDERDLWVRFYNAGDVK